MNARPLAPDAPAPDLALARRRRRGASAKSGLGEAAGAGLSRPERGVRGGPAEPRGPGAVSPAEVHLAAPRGAHRPVIDYLPVRVHVFAVDTFELGRERIRLESGEEIYIYSPERSAVDAVRMRGRVGTDVAYEALRRYLRRPGASPGDLLRLARRLRAGGPMSDALEVLTG